jgi:hypothetical protein
MGDEGDEGRDPSCEEGGRGCNVAMKSLRIKICASIWVVASYEK